LRFAVKSRYQTIEVPKDAFGDTAKGKWIGKTDIKYRLILLDIPDPFQENKNKIKKEVIKCHTTKINAYNAAEYGQTDQVCV